VNAGAIPAREMLPNCRNCNQPLGVGKHLAHDCNRNRHKGPLVFEVTATCNVCGLITRTASPRLKGLTWQVIDCLRVGHEVTLR